MVWSNHLNRTKGSLTDFLQVLYLEWVQELGLEYRELGMVHRVDTGLHWQRNADRSQLSHLHVCWVGACLGYHRSSLGSLWDLRGKTILPPR
jgi:hypothetical protein